MIIKTVILARAGSKTIKNKNIYPLNGKPLIYYSIIESLKSKYIDETYVSTDGKEIANCARKYGAKIFNRNPINASSVSSSEDAILEFASEIDFDILVFVQCTSPMIKYQYIDKGIEMVKGGNYDSTFSCLKKHFIPEYTKNLEPLNFKGNYPRRQDREEILVDIGAFYVIKRETLLENKFRLGGKIGTVELPLSESFQVDDMEDLKLIEKLMK